MKCPTCKKGALHPWDGPLTIVGVNVTVHGEHCDSCDEILFSDAELERQEKKVAAVLVERGVRTAKEFKFVRKVAELKATEVAEMLDVAAETISRWESGERPIPRMAAFALGELFEHPKLARKKLEALAV
jgi:putative zinc finger/helix-turn-helix YgiT family protein